MGKTVSVGWPPKLRTAGCVDRQEMDEHHVARRITEENRASSTLSKSRQ